jgi:transposase
MCTLSESVQRLVSVLSVCIYVPSMWDVSSLSCILIMEVPYAIRCQIIQHFNAGLYTQRQISEMVFVSTSTVNYIIKQYRQTGQIESRGKERSGRPRKLGPRDERALRRHSLENPRATARQCQQEVGGELTTVSISTVKRSLIRLGRITQRPLYAPCLTESQKRTRKTWCEKYRHWSDEQWLKVGILTENIHEIPCFITSNILCCCICAQVVFSDETYIDVDSSVRSQYVRRSRDEACTTLHANSRRQYRQRVLFWGCFSGIGGPGPMVDITGTMRTCNYVTTMQQHLLPHLIQLENSTLTRGVVFMQDNAPCHKSQATLQFLEEHNVNVLDWPPYSPDLNPIENLWSVLKRKVHSSSHSSRESVVQAAHAAWNDDSLPYTCHKLAMSMRRRILNCIDNKGGYTHY